MAEVAAQLAAFAVCAPGIERLLADEMRELGVAAPRRVPGGVEFAADAAAIARVNRGSALAVRVLLRVAEFGVSRLPELRRKAGNVEWDRWLDPAVPLAVRARCRKSKLYHSGAVEERVAAALADAGAMLDPEADSFVHVRVERNACTLSIDTSGAPLHRRGWRLASTKAPLREDLAAALVRASGWDRRMPLIDPLAGSGTIAIEAACAACGLAPGRLRGFAFEGAPWFDGVGFDGVGAAPLEAAEPAARGTIHASDRDDGAVAAMRANADRAGVSDAIRVDCAALRGAPGFEAARAMGAPALVICNPPYGKRVGAAAPLRDLYAALGQEIRSLPAGSRAVVLAADAALIRATGLRMEPLFSTEHGGLRVTAFRC